MSELVSKAMNIVTVDEVLILLSISRFLLGWLESKRILAILGFIFFFIAEIHVLIASMVDSRGKTISLFVLFMSFYRILLLLVVMRTFVPVAIYHAVLFIFINIIFLRLLISIVMMFLIVQLPLPFFLSAVSIFLLASFLVFSLVTTFFFAMRRFFLLL